MTKCFKSINRVVIAGFVGVAAISLVSCTKSKIELKDQPNVELIQDMMDQPALKAQDYEPGQPKKGSVRLPPDHTVPVGYQPYPYHFDPDGAAAHLKNPLAGDYSPQVLELGRKKYDTYCAVCHGMSGQGDGPVAPKMALRPPTLMSDKVRNFKDASIYHIITDGQGVMASYVYQLRDEKDRWAIVNYVRSLQKLNK